MYDQLVQIVLILAAAGFGGGVSSLFVSMITQAQWPNEAKNAVAFLFCIAVAFLGTIVFKIEPHNLGLMIPAMIIGCREAYLRFWKPHGIAPWIEEITTLTK